MRTTKDIINSFSEPFKSATKLERAQFDFKLVEGKDDHTYLKKLGYELVMSGDCSFHVKGLCNLSASSYGNWGTCYFNQDEEMIDGYPKSFHVFCQMIQDNIVKLWRLRFYQKKTSYEYNEDNKTWIKNENGKWIKTTTPQCLLHPLEDKL